MRRSMMRMFDSRKIVALVLASAILNPAFAHQNDKHHDKHHDKNTNVNVNVNNNNNHNNHNTNVNVNVHNDNHHNGGVGLGIGLVAGLAIGTAIATPPPQHTTVVVSGTSYIYASGVYYQPVPAGGYVVVAAPVGAPVAVVPAQ